MDSRFRVGGPASAGWRMKNGSAASWSFAAERGIPLDFVTRHHYTTEVPETAGHYGYVKLRNRRRGFENLQSTRDIVDSFAQYRGLEIHITEFNTSYVPNCPLHDTNQNAAYIAHQLSRLGDVNESYSYWTFGDIFEEFGVPFTPFHGGFGLVANGGIPKPTFWTFRFFKELQGTCVHRSEDAVIVKCGGWKISGGGLEPDDERERRNAGAGIPASHGNKAGEYRGILHPHQTVDEVTCNPLKLWHDMGEPSSLSEAQKKLLKEGAKPFVETHREHLVDGKVQISLMVRENGVVYFEVFPVKDGSDRGTVTRR